MKKILLLLLCVIFALSAFMGCEEAEENSPDKESLPDESSVPEESYEIIVVDIVCDAEDKQNANDSEIIYIDETTVYVLKGSSQDIIVSYSDGSRQNVKDALEEGNITIEDLDRFEIRYTKIAKTDLPIGEIPEESNKSDLEVIDIVLPSGCYGDLIDLFYSDDEYDYFFPSLTKYSMKVYYSDGSVQNVKEAIDAGNITLADLDKFDIYYFKETKGKYSSFD